MGSARRLELLLTLAVAWLLFEFAAPLAAPGADLGLQARYGAAPDLGLGWLPDLAYRYAWTRVPQDLRAVLLLRHAGAWLLLLAIAGWTALQWVRQGSASAAGLALCLWLALAWLLRPFQLAGLWWAAGLALASAGTLVAQLRSPPGAQPPTRPSAIPPLTAWTALVWPGWMLLTGAGWLVILDFAARGPLVPDGLLESPLRPGARYFGLNQADGLWLASGLLIASACWRAHLVRAWVRLCAVLAALWQRPRGPPVLMVLALFCSLSLGWLGASEHRAFLGINGLRGAGRPHISGEVLRLVCCAALAWFAYRFGEWRGSPRRAWDGLRHLALVLALGVLGLVWSDDKGPLLVIALATAVLLGVPLLQWVGSGRSGPAKLAGRGAALLLAAGLAIAMLGLWRTALTDWLPRVSKDAAVRELLRANPFEARSPNLAQARWLMDATPAGGFGLARVPYCGARAAAGQAGCTLSSGAPLQMPSDFAFAPLFASWGATGASVLVFATLLWLFALPAGMLAAWRDSGTWRPAHRVGLLPIWLVAVPALVAQAQIVVSVGATLGWSSLTGVTLPLLGYGSASLCAAATWVGMAANPGVGEP